MTDTDRAYEALGKTRSELATYMRHNVKQQKRIRELEKELGRVLELGKKDRLPVSTIVHAATILKGKE